MPPRQGSCWEWWARPSCGRHRSDFSHRYAKVFSQVSVAPAWFRSIIGTLLLDRMQKPPIPCRRMEERENVAMRDENIVTPTPASAPVKEATQESTPAPL